MKREEIQNIESKIETGDIGLSINDKFVSKAIRFFMNIYRVIKGLPKMKLYNHSFHFIWIEDELFTVEAIGRGGALRPYKHAYLKKGIRHKIKTPKESFTENEKDEIIRYSVQFIGENKEYNFLNFPLQIIYVLTGGRKWYGKTGKKAEKRIYCTETTATIINHVRQIWPRPWAANPLDIDTAKQYKDKIDLT